MKIYLATDKFIEYSSYYILADDLSEAYEEASYGDNNYLPNSGPEFDGTDIEEEAVETIHLYNTVTNNVVEIIPSRHGHTDTSYWGHRINWITRTVDISMFEYPKEEWRLVSIS